MKKVSKIVLIGAGNLGSRHLQAIAKTNMPIEIEVVEPNDMAKEVALQRFKEIPANDNIRKITFLAQMDELSKKIDVAIVATSSQGRANIVRELTDNREIRFMILEKFLFQTLEEYEMVNNLLTRKGICAWVNCPRRMFAFYSGLREKLQRANVINMVVDGGEWGLGCNGIHMLDIFSFLIDDEKFEVDLSGLDEGYIESKRSGYIEFVGQIALTSKKGTLTLVSKKGSSKPLLMMLDSNVLHCTINEAEKTAWISEKDDKWQLKKVAVDFQFQSSLTNIVVEQLLENGTCDLTKYEESAGLHEIVLKGLCEHLSRFENKEVKKCPIT